MSELNDDLMAGLPAFDADYDLEEELRRGREDGSLIRAKARMIYEEVVLPRIAIKAADPHLSAESLVKISDHVATMADIKPKPAESSSQGPAFNVSIVFQPGFTPPVVGVQAQEAAPIDASYSVKDELLELSPDALPEPDSDVVQPLPVPDFKLT